jgi:hypothetical protein
MNVICIPLRRMRKSSTKETARSGPSTTFSFQRS